MTRPFLDSSIDQLETDYERATTNGDSDTMDSLLHELSFRKTPQAKELRDAIEHAAKGTPKPKQADLPIHPPKSQLPQRRSTGHQKPAQTPSKHKPTPEQSGLLPVQWTPS